MKILEHIIAGFLYLIIRPIASTIAMLMILICTFSFGYYGGKYTLKEVATYLKEDVLMHIVQQFKK